jgi:hypothetical protein
LDEVFLNGDLQETSKSSIIRVVAAQESLVEEKENKN